MRISCPNCSATYDVPAELAAGRPVVRCVQCAEQWKLGQATSQPVSRPQRPEMPPAEALLAPIPDAVLGRAPTPEPGPATTPVAAAVDAVTTELTGDSLVLERPPTAAQGADAAAAPAEAALDTGRKAEPITAVMEEVASQDAPGVQPVVTTATPATPAKPVQADGPSAAQLVLASIAGNLIAAAGWAFSLGIVLALGWMAVYHRTGIMHAWPPSQRLFTWLGLA